MGSAMVGFILLPTLLLLLPLTLSDKLPPGRTLLIETVDEPKNEHRNAENHEEEEKLPSEHISKNDSGNDYSLDLSRPYKGGKKRFCAGSGMHGAPCTLGKSWRFPGRCCAATCKHLKGWLSDGCPKPEGVKRWKPWPHNGGEQRWNPLARSGKYGSPGNWGG